MTLHYPTERSHLAPHCHCSINAFNLSRDDSFMIRDLVTRVTILHTRYKIMAGTTEICRFIRLFC